MLTDKVEFVIGVDTHRDSHTAAVVTAAGGVVDRLTVATDAFGFRKLDAFVAAHATGRRVWAIEGTGSFGAGLTTHLLQRGEWVVEIDRPARPARRDGAKSDDLDAVRAAREALTREHLAAPRARGDRDRDARVVGAPRHGARDAGCGRGVRPEGSLTWQASATATARRAYSAKVMHRLPASMSSDRRGSARSIQTNTLRGLAVFRTNFHPLQAGRVRETNEIGRSMMHARQTGMYTV